MEQNQLNSRIPILFIISRLMNKTFVFCILQKENLFKHPLLFEPAPSKRIMIRNSQDRVYFRVIIMVNKGLLRVAMILIVMLSSLWLIQSSKTNRHRHNFWLMSFSNRRIVFCKFWSGLVDELNFFLNFWRWNVYL